MNGINSLGYKPADFTSLAQPMSPPSDASLQVKEKFQEFVAGTFYAQMLKALHKTHGTPAYFHGGQAEEIFQGQMDQEVAAALSKQHGASFSDPLFRSFERRFAN